MRREIEMPRLSEAVEEGVLVTWLVEPGATVREGDLIAEVQVEKASSEVRAPAAGRLDDLLFVAGDVVRQGAPIAVLESSGASGGGRAGRRAGGAGRGRRAPGRPRRSPRPGRSWRRRRRSAWHESSGSICGPSPDPDPGAGSSRRTLPRRPRHRRAGANRARCGRRAAVRDAPHDRRTIAVGSRLDRAAHADRGGGRHRARREARRLVCRRRPADHVHGGDRARMRPGAARPSAGRSDLERARASCRSERIDIGVAVALDDGLIVPVVRDADHKDLATLGRGDRRPRRTGPPAERSRRRTRTGPASA